MMPQETDPLEQAEKLRVLRELVTEGLDDIAAGRVSDWNFQEFLCELRNARTAAADPDRQ